MTIKSGFSTTINRPQFKIYKSGLTAPVEGETKFLFSPGIPNEGGQRTLLFQANHVTPTATVKSSDFSSFYEKISSAEAGAYQYQHTNSDTNGTAAAADRFTATRCPARSSSGRREARARMPDRACWKRAFWPDAEILSAHTICHQ